MGAYVNPPNGGSFSEEAAKAEWLKKFAEETQGPTQPDAEYVPLCWVHNYHFTAIGVGFSPNEVKAFVGSSDDLRPKRWFRAKREDVRKVSDLADYER